MQRLEVHRRFRCIVAAKCSSRLQQLLLPRCGTNRARYSSRNLREKKIVMKRHARFAAALLDGLGSSVSIFEPARLHRMTGSDLGRMRDDARRVGNTMRDVTARESAKHQSGQEDSTKQTQ